MKTVKSYTLEEINKYKKKVGEEGGETLDRFFDYQDLRIDLEENIKLMKEVIEEKILENYVQNNYYDDLLMIQEAYEANEMTEEEVDEEVQALKDLAKDEMEEGFYNEKYGILGKYKTKKTYEWDDSINDLLIEKGLLAKTKKINAKIASFVDLSGFQYESTEKYIKVAESLKGSAEVKALQKELNEQRKEMKKKELQLLDLDDLLKEFKNAKTKQDVLNSIFEEDKNNIKSLMINENIKSMSNQEILVSKGIEDGTIRNLTLVDVQGDFNNDAILNETFEAEVLIFVKESENDIVVYDYGMDKEYVIENGKYKYILGKKFENHNLTLTVNGQVIQGIKDLASIEKRKTAKLKKFFTEYVEENNGFVINEKLEFTGKEILIASDCKTEEIEKYVEEEKLPYAEVKAKKELKHATPYFELIEEEKDKARREVFNSKRERKINTILKRQAQKD